MGLSHRKKVTFVSKKDRKFQRSSGKSNLKRVKLSKSNISLQKKNKYAKETNTKKIEEMNEKELEYKLKCEFATESKLTHEELDTIKKSYLSRRKKKDTNITSSGQSSRNILNFDWNVKDDTSYDSNPLYKYSGKRRQRKDNGLNDSTGKDYMEAIR